MRRELAGKWNLVARLVCLAFALFHVYTGGFGLLPDMRQRAIHILFGFGLTFFLVSATKRKEKTVSPLDLLLIGLTIAAAINSYIKYEWFLINLGESTTLDIFLGAAIIVLSLEAARRVTGWVFTLLTLAAIMYAFLGPYIPGSFGHPGFRPIYVIQQLYQSTMGIYGFVTGISASILAIFIVLGNFLIFSGGGQTFMDLALKVAGKYRGGPALVGVVASGLFGTISGSAVVNVATVGNFTIPLMKRLGYKPEFAGGVEAISSTGGQIMPPVMGAGAFVMAELINVSYLSIVIAAIIPACLFYLAVFAATRFYAVRAGLPPVPPEEILPIRKILTWQKMGPLVFPVGVLLGFLARGYGAVTAAFWALAVAFVIYMITSSSWQQAKEKVLIVIGGLERAGEAMIQIVSVAVCANILIALLNMTGVAVKISDVIMAISGGQLFIGLIMGAIVALVLGMGMPTTPAYIIAAAVVAPAFVLFGLPPIAGHMFIFYFAIISVVTPPVCVAAFVAAPIAGARWQDIANIAVKLGIVAYIVPFAFIYQPALLMMGSPLEIVIAVLILSVACILLAAGIFGYFTTELRPLSRVLVILGGLMMFVPGVTFALVGVALGIVAQVYERFFRKIRAGT